MKIHMVGKSTDNEPSSGSCCHGVLILTLGGTLYLEKQIKF